MDVSQILSDRIKELSKNQNKPIVTILADCTLNRNFIYDLERRKSMPACDKIYKLADYFNVSIDYLVGRTDNPQVYK